MDKPTEPIERGLPLRQFVRGFLHDHLGLSKIMAHHGADVFMERWTARDPETVKRYQHEDIHTRVATFNRRTMAEADAKIGASKAQKAEVEKRREKGLTFPDRPIIPTTVLVFDDTALKPSPEGRRQQIVAELNKLRTAPLTNRIRIANLEAELASLKLAEPKTWLGHTGDQVLLKLARLVELEEANDKAPGWGAAVGARAEEIKAIKLSLGLKLR